MYAIKENNNYAGHLNNNGEFLPKNKQTKLFLTEAGAQRAINRIVNNGIRNADGLKVVQFS